MIITPHLLTGSAIGARSKNVWLTFIFGFLSHFLLDALPHWDYVDSLKELTMPINWLKVAIDLIVGISVILLIVRFTDCRVKKGLFFIGGAAAILPDLLICLYFFLNIKLLKPLALVHNWLHCRLTFSFFWQDPLLLAAVSLLAVFIFIKSCRALAYEN